jgi:hypothetical protein
MPIMKVGDNAFWRALEQSHVLVGSRNWALLRSATVAGIDELVPRTAVSTSAVSSTCACAQSAHSLTSICNWKSKSCAIRHHWHFATSAANSTPISNQRLAL